MKPRYLLFAVNAETSTVAGYPGHQFDWTKFCWDGSEWNDVGVGVEMQWKAPLPFVDDYLIAEHCQYLHVPYDFVEDGIVYRIRPRNSLQAGHKYHRRLIVQQRAVRREDGWYWEIELEGEV